MALEELNPQVLVSHDEVTLVGPADLERVKRMALTNAIGRARICAHPTPEASLHEMLIALRTDQYIRPHAHRDKSESFHMIEGNLSIILFHADGRIRQRIDMSAEGPGTRYYRLAAPIFHTVVPWSQVVLFHETTNGPYRREDAVYPDWAPAETETPAGRAFLAQLLRRLETHPVAAAGGQGYA